MISKTTKRMIESRDKKCGCIKISELVSELLEKKHVTVGYRTTCGSQIDQTQKDFQMFREVVSRLKKDGFHIEESRGEKQKNGYATNNGGFWGERVFTVLSCPCCGSDDVYLTDAVHCGKCAVTTEISKD